MSLSKLVEKETQASKVDAEILMAMMRVGVARLRLITCDLEEIGCHLKHGAISAETAVAWINETPGIAPFLALPTPIDVQSRELRA